MRRDRTPSEDRGRAPRPVWDNPGSQLLQGEETILYLKELVGELHSPKE